MTLESPYELHNQNWAAGAGFRGRESGLRTQELCLRPSFRTPSDAPQYPLKSPSNPQPKGVKPPPETEFGSRMSEVRHANACRVLSGSERDKSEPELHKTSQNFTEFPYVFGGNLRFLVKNCLKFTHCAVTSLFRRKFKDQNHDPGPRNMRRLCHRTRPNLNPTDR